MNIRQVKWASEYDWYIEAGFSIGYGAPNDYTVQVREYVVNPYDDSKMIVVIKAFSSFTKLYEWAGY